METNFKPFKAESRPYNLVQAKSPAKPVKSTFRPIINLDDDSKQGLRKLSDDIKRYSNKRKPNGKHISQFSFADVVRICVACGAIVATLKIMLWIWSF